MVNPYLQYYQLYAALSKEILSPCYDLSTLPVENIISSINNIFDGKYETRNSMLEAYTELIASACEQCSRTSLSAIFSTLSNICLIFAYDKAQLNQTLVSNYELMTQIHHIENQTRISNWYLSHQTCDSSTIPFTGKGVVYSAITGDYDNVKEPQYINANLDYILFTNNPNLKSQNWKIILVDNVSNLDNVRLARHIKIMGHEYLKNYDYSIWVDGKLTIKGDFIDFINKYRKKEHLLCFPHYITNDIYQESVACLRLNKGNADEINKQINRYRKENYPEQSGMIDSAILVRDLHHPLIIKLMTSWWNEIKNESYRDQLSFNYVCWKNDFIYDSTDLFVYQNSYVESNAHK